MKGKILHIVRDFEIGGIHRVLADLTNSRLKDKFNFAMVNKTLFPKVVNHIKPDLIIYHDSSSWSRIPELLSIRQEAKLVIHEHHYCRAFEQSKVPFIPKFRLMLKTAYKIADRVVTVSQSQANWIIENDISSASKVIAIQQSPNLNHLLALPLKQVRYPLILGAYGRFSEQKGFDILIKAMSLLPQGTVQLNLGGYGDDKETLLQSVREQSNINFLGLVKDVSAFLQLCDVVVIPSRWEPWGNVCLEAKAAGKPVIASRVDGLIEQVTDCGILVLPEDPHLLAGAIEEMSALPSSTLVAWGQNARESASQAWEKYLLQWEEFLLDMLESI